MDQNSRQRNQGQFFQNISDHDYDLETNSNTPVRKEQPDEGGILTEKWVDFCAKAHNKPKEEWKVSGGVTSTNKWEYFESPMTTMNSQSQHQKPIQ